VEEEGQGCWGECCEGDLGIDVYLILELELVGKSMPHLRTNMSLVSTGKRVDEKCGRGGAQQTSPDTPHHVNVS
jgi:hypothetical protein